MMTGISMRLKKILITTAIPSAKTQIAKPKIKPPKSKNVEKIV